MGFKNNNFKGHFRNEIMSNSLVSLPSVKCLKHCDVVPIEVTPNNVSSKTMLAHRHQHLQFPEFKK